MENPTCKNCQKGLHIACGTSTKAVQSCACAEKFHKR